VHTYACTSTQSVLVPAVVVFTCQVAAKGIIRTTQNRNGEPLPGALLRAGAPLAASCNTFTYSRLSGKSIGAQDLATDSLRWLTNDEQALEDSANFMRNVNFDGIDEDFTAHNTPWIYYGLLRRGTVGSHAYARS
jgi:hypothetical protein